MFFGSLCFPPIEAEIWKHKHRTSHKILLPSILMKGIGFDLSTKQGSRGFDFKLSADETFTQCNTHLAHFTLSTLWYTRQWSLKFFCQNPCYKTSSSIWIWNAHQSWVETRRWSKTNSFSNRITKDLVRRLSIFWQPWWTGGIGATIKTSSLYHKFNPRETVLPRKV